MNEKRFVQIFIAITFVALLVLAFTLNGTADSGDSVYHFLHAKYVYQHPGIFFYNWSKPLYVLLSSPFAQLGFIGAKIFNIINTVLAMIATYFVARKLNLHNSWFAPVLLVIAPMNMALALSGLTEPLFGTVIICGLCLLFYNKTALGLIVLSFMPFVRSEGMFLLIIVAIYLITQRKYKSILLLATGQVVYAIAGYFYTHNIFWFYDSNPYSLASRYGHGGWLDYIKSMPIIIGYASKYLLFIGVIVVLIGFCRSVLKYKTEVIPWQIMLVLSLFMAYFMFHVIAWKYGLFDSFGMTRIIVATAPLMALLCLCGINAIIDIAQKYIKRTSIISVLIFTSVILINLFYFVWKIDDVKGEPGFTITMAADQEIEQQMAGYIKQKYPDYKNKLIIYDATYLAMALNIDPFNNGTHHEHLDDGNKMPANSFCIWDDWFAVMQGGIALEMLTKDNSIVRDTAFSKADASGKMRSVILFRK